MVVVGVQEKSWCCVQGVHKLTTPHKQTNKQKTTKKVKPYIRIFKVKIMWKRLYRAWLLLALCWDNSKLIFSNVKPLWPWIKVKVIEMSMSIYVMHKSTFMPSWNVIAEILSDILLLNYKLKYVKFETQLWPWVKVKVIGLARIIQTISRTMFAANLMGVAWKVSEIIEHLVFSRLRPCVTLNEGQSQYN